MESALSHRKLKLSMVKRRLSQGAKPLKANIIQILKNLPHGILTSERAYGSSEHMNQASGHMDQVSGHIWKAGMHKQVFISHVKL